AAPLDDADGSIENRVCMPFLAGYCTFGDKCFNCHPEPQQVKRLLAKYSRTKCRFGKDCKTSGCLYNHGEEPVAGWMAPSVDVGKVEARPVPRSLLYQQAAQRQYGENNRVQRTVYANGPTYVPHTSNDGGSSWVEVQLDTVKIPDGVWRNHEDGTAAAAFSIQDPIERFKYVNADRPLPTGQDGDIVIDLHFQSLKSVEQALDFALNFALWRHPCLSVWVVTGVGTHVPEGHQRKGGVLFEAVKEAVEAGSYHVRSGTVELKSTSLPPGRKYREFIMQSSGIDTIEAARHIEAQCGLEKGVLKVARKRRSAYGTTVQLLSAAAGHEADLSGFKQGENGIYVGPAPKVWLDEENRKTIGQRYTCVVRGVSAGRDVIEERINSVINSGVANLWAPDKFGKAEIRTYELGARLLKGDYGGFIRLLVGANRHESSRTWEAWKAFQQGDLSACAVALPTDACRVTTAVVMMLNKTAGDAEAAMRAVPSWMRWSLKKAVDAYVWNQVAKFRLTSMLTDHAVEGDWVLLDGGSVTRVTSRDARAKTYPISRVLLPISPVSETEPQDYPLNAAAFAYTKARENLGLNDSDLKEAISLMGKVDEGEEKPLLYRPLVAFPTEVQWDLVTCPVGQSVVTTDAVRNGLADHDLSNDERHSVSGGRKRGPRSETCLRLRFTLEKAHDCGGRMVLREILQRPIHEFMPASLARQDLLF
ncbi:hypothetical protein FOL47_005765, partial [Perkinsus chesapeaki]